MGEAGVGVVGARCVGSFLIASTLLIIVGLLLLLAENRLQCMGDPSPRRRVGGVSCGGERGVGGHEDGDLMSGIAGEEGGEMGRRWRRMLRECAMRRVRGLWSGICRG